MTVKKRTSVYDFHFHLIWVTKYRKKIFNTDEKRNEMKSILNGLAESSGVIIENIEVMPDHIHLLVSFPPHFTPSSVVKMFKGVSSRLYFKKRPEVRDALWGGHLWSGSYFMSTLGSMSKDVVNNYINSQMSKTPKEQADCRNSSRH